MEITVARARDEEDIVNYVPVHVVWEITLGCDLKCKHCGSRAGKRRPDELNTEEALDVVDQLARLGTREITLIGGEAYLRKDWVNIIRRARSHGIYTAIQTGARNLTDERIEAAIDAGLQGVGVSVDGLPALHDKIRGVPGAFDKAISALERCKARGLKTSANTVIGQPTVDELPELMHRLIDAGATHWQVQLIVAMGNAVDNDELILQPYQIPALMDLLAKLYHEGNGRDFLMVVGNNIGYFGPYEQLWRGYMDEEVHWGGCAAGQNAIGIEANGAIKGCPSLATIGFTGGNVRDMSIEDIWQHSDEIHFARLRGLDDLWGFCRTCYYADVCRGGCTWTTHSMFGKPGNNPYCHYRSLELRKRGLRERVVKRKEAPDASFSVGEFELIREPIPGANGNGNGKSDSRAAIEPAPATASAAAGRLTEEERALRRKRGRVAPELDICRSCNFHIFDHEETCPHCGADVEESKKKHAADVERRHKLIAEVQQLIEEAKKAKS